MSARPAIYVGVAAAVLFVLLAIVAPRAAAGGWLIAYLCWSNIALGSLALLMIHRLTGGRWGVAYAPVFWPMAACVPVVALLLIPVFALLPAFYPWAGNAAAVVQPDVARIYLNRPWFIIHAVIAFGGWLAILLALARLSGAAGAIAAGVGLAFHALIVGVVGLDWIQSIEPPFFSTSFGASLAITQMLAALAFAAVLMPVRMDGAVSDLAGLMLATVLGLTYIDFMAYLIIWYGDLPHRVTFFLHRGNPFWVGVVVTAFLLVSIIPTFALMPAAVRASAGALRIIGLVILVGVALYQSWLVGAAFGPWSLATALLAMLIMGALLLAFARSAWSQGWLQQRRAASVN